MTGGETLLAGLFPPLTSRTGRTWKCFNTEATLEDTFCFEKLIGRGGFSEVWQARYCKQSKEDLVAIKLIPKARCSSSQVANEVAVMKAVQGSLFVIQVINCFQSLKHYAIVMKHATRGTLHDRLKIVRCFSELVSRFYAAEIAEGLFSLHAKGIIHRDLNLDNVLICENGHIVLSDFGLSVLREPDEIHEPIEPWIDGCGKPQFAAPEFILGMQYDKTVDWWAYGIILYRMICGELPYAKSSRKTGKKITAMNDMEFIYRPEHYPNFISPSAKFFISKLLARKMVRRLGYGKFEENDVASVTFFINVDWCQLRDQVLPAPFTELLGPTHHRKRSIASLPTSYLGTAHLPSNVNITPRDYGREPEGSSRGRNDSGSRSMLDKTMSWIRSTHSHVLIGEKRKKP